MTPAGSGVRQLSILIPAAPLASCVVLASDSVSLSFFPHLQKEAIDRQLRVVVKTERREASFYLKAPSAVLEKVHVDNNMTVTFLPCSLLKQIALSNRACFSLCGGWSVTSGQPPAKDCHEEIKEMEELYEHKRTKGKGCSHRAVNSFGCLFQSDSKAVAASWVGFHLVNIHVSLSWTLSFLIL